MSTASGKTTPMAAARRNSRRAASNGIPAPTAATSPTNSSSRTEFAMTVTDAAVAIGAIAALMVTGTGSS